jgi:hypothetical protein
MYGKTSSVAQESALPAYTSSALIVTLPIVPSISTVISWQIAMAELQQTLLVSLTVTLAVQLDELPFKSVTVSVIKFVPTSAHEKLDCEIPIMAFSKPQASLLPPSISSGPIMAFPEPSSAIEISLHKTVGGVKSSTVTMAVQLSESPFKSAIVKITSFTAPISEQSKLLLFIKMSCKPQVASLPPSTSETEIVTAPVLSKVAV